MLRNISAATFVFILLVFGTTVAAEQDTIEWKPNSGEHLEIVCPKLSGSPTMDGVLDDDCWKEAVQTSNFTEFEPEERTEPTVRTEVFVCYDDRNLYVGFVCYETDVSKIRSTLSNRDEFSNDDYVWILMDTFGDLQTGYEFGVNPYGVQLDAYISEGNEDFTFDTNWESGAKILNDRWEAEIRIPFKSVRFPSKAEQHWRIDFIRTRPRESREQYSWAPISLDNPSLFDQSGHLWVREKIVGGGRSIDFLPYIISSQIGSLDDLSDPQSFRNKWPGASIGLSMKYGITSNLILDLALNPDYSQIETDVTMIDVNTTFALYYPEKRPFFLEGKDIFDTFINAVYTRSVNDPLLAAKLTGKIGRFGIGVITARDDHTPWIVPFEEYSYTVSSNKKSLSNVVRIKRDILKDSYVGAIITDRELEGSFNRTIDVDWNIRFLKHYNFYFQLLGSWTKEPNDTILSCNFNGFTFGKHTSDFDGESFCGTAYDLFVGRSARHWNFGVWHWGISPEFRVDNGFIEQNNFKDSGFWTGYIIRPNKWGVERIHPQVEVDVMYSYQGELKSKSITPSMPITFRKQTGLNFGGSLYSESFKGERFNNMWHFFCELRNEYSDRISGGVFLQIGETINYVDLSLGDLKRLTVDAEIKPMEKLRTSFSYDWYELQNESGARSALQHVLFNKITYQFSRHLSFRLVTQYSRKQIGQEISPSKLNVDPLISYELNPFTVFYFGSTHNIQDFADPFGMRETGHQIFLKLRYQFKTTS